MGDQFLWLNWVTLNKGCYTTKGRLCFENLWSRMCTTQVILCPRGVSWGGGTKGAPKKGKEKKKRGKRRKVRSRQKKKKIGKSTWREGRYSGVGCAPSNFFVEMGRLSLCGRLGQKECTKSREFASIFFSPLLIWGDKSPSDFFFFNITCSDPFRKNRTF